MNYIISRGVHPSSGNDAFPTCFRLFPYFQEIFILWKISHILPFPKKFLDFQLPKFPMTFFSHQPQISNFLLFSLFQYISPLFAKIITSPLLEKCPPCFRKILLLFTYFLCISCPPYFDHDAFMHHPMRVLDASDNQKKT